MKENTLLSAVVIPLAQSIISALLLAVGAYALAVWLEIGDPFTLALGVFGISSLGAWFFYRAEWRSRLEALLGIQYQAPAAEPVKEFRLEVVTDNGHTGDLLKFPGGIEKLCELSRALVSGKPYTVRTFTGPGGIYSPTEFDQVRNELLARGFLQWVSPHAHTSGVVVTAKGWATFRGLATRYPLPQTYEEMQKVKQFPL